VAAEEASLGLGAALTAAGVRDTLTDTTTRAAYSRDASLYRVVPQAVVRPRHGDEVAATLQVCRELGVPLTACGAADGFSCRTQIFDLTERRGQHLAELLAAHLPRSSRERRAAVSGT